MEVIVIINNERHGRSFNPSVSMDYSGSFSVSRINLLVVSFNPSVSMDYSGRKLSLDDAVNYGKFQSFCINGLLWKNYFDLQYISRIFCFNPSVSMDYSGSRLAFTKSAGFMLFQSFCINGLLWKKTIAPPVSVYGIFVSILLYQWITLEAFLTVPKLPKIITFQSFCINGLLWNVHGHRGQRKKCGVSILLYQWITLEVVKRNLKLYAKDLFQSFCINGLLWKL